jgi:hypothetical protein
MRFASGCLYAFLFLVLACLSILLAGWSIFISPVFAIGLIPVAIGVPFLWREAVRGRRQNQMVVNDREFSQNGVTVDFVRRVVVLNSIDYRPEAILGTAVSWGMNTASVDISLDDFKTPVHRVRFQSYKAKEYAENFLERFQLALRKIS